MNKGKRDFIIIIIIFIASGIGLPSSYKNFASFVIIMIRNKFTTKSTKQKVGLMTIIQLALLEHKKNTGVFMNIASLLSENSRLDLTQGSMLATMIYIIQEVEVDK
ncbi:hypothetical protein KFK09_017523 [Dendrobium nobile]|uniref:Uncharacterized protein n=1 Tax=Dendrobium nobile TaxID=94219 RepID=A0A8T3B1J6_DENNO|nr:hypothetical protein KFK09_017523 [Dendrobium nobile]